MDNLSRPELIKLCKERGFVKYSSLNKHELKNLLKRGSHKTPPKPYVYRVLHSDMGLKPADFDREKYVVKYIEHVDDTNTREVSKDIINYLQNGYCSVRGMNIEGMFNSIWIPPKVIQIEYFNDYYASDEEEEEENNLNQSPVFVPYTQHGSWMIPRSELKNFKDFYDSLKPIDTPKTLFELAARVVNSRKITQYVPPTLLKRIKAVK